jgi:hypothetical protein
VSTAPTITAEDKRLASVTARLALTGVELRRAADGSFVATRFDLSRALPNLDAAELFATAALDRIR